jgi:hypothetical protein
VTIESVKDLASQSDRFLLIAFVVAAGFFAYRSITFLVGEIKMLVTERDKSLRECIDRNTDVLKLHNELLLKYVKEK